MNLDWPSFLIGVVTLPALLIVSVVLATVIRRLASKNLAVHGCLVCDDGFVCENGEYTRLGIWLRSRRHNWILRNRRAHRDAWARHRWNPYRLPGYPEGNGQAALRRPKPNILVRAWWFIIG